MCSAVLGTRLSACAIAFMPIGVLERPSRRRMATARVTAGTALGVMIVYIQLLIFLYNTGDVGRPSAAMKKLTDFTSYADAQANFASAKLWELFDGDRERL